MYIWLAMRFTAARTRPRSVAIDRDNFLLAAAGPQNKMLRKIWLLSFFQLYLLYVLETYLLNYYILLYMFLSHLNIQKKSSAIYF